MPSTPEAIAVYQDNGLLYGPAKAANAGGVAVSGLEMSQNSYRLSWTFEEVDNKLKSIMENIVANSLAAAKEYGHEGDLMLGANAAGFVKVANAWSPRACSDRLSQSVSTSVRFVRTDRFHMRYGITRNAV